MATSVYKAGLNFGLDSFHILDYASLTLEKAIKCNLPGKQL